MGKSLEQIADEFDADLFRLIDKAWTMVERGPLKDKWRQVALDLGTARPTVRSMMAPHRRKETA